MMKLYLQILLFLGVSVTASVFASDKYRVSLQVFSLGELIALPVVVVEEDQTSSVSNSMPGEAQYVFILLVRPATDDEVSVSIQFVSGKINLQPNLLVKLNEQAAVTIDETHINLLVQKEPEPMSESHPLAGTSWRVEGIAGNGIIDMSHTTLRFGDGGRIVGDTGCNRYFGSVELAENSMVFGPLAATRKMCAPALMDQEQAFLQAMSRVGKWRVAETGLLHLGNLDGSEVLRALQLE